MVLSNYVSLLCICAFHSNFDFVFSNTREVKEAFKEFHVAIQ